VFRAMVDFGGGSNLSGMYHRVRLQQAPVQGLLDWFEVHLGLA